MLGGWAYGALYRDMQGISWPSPGEDAGGLGSNSAALMAWAQELEAAARTAAASASWSAAQETERDFEGATYKYLPFIQEAAGEFYAYMDLTASNLGIELPKSTGAPTP